LDATNVRLRDTTNARLRDAMAAVRPAMSAVVITVRLGTTLRIKPHIAQIPQEPYQHPEW
jgi:hypothetical protein